MRVAEKQPDPQAINNRENQKMSMKAITELKGEYRFLSNFWPSPVEYDGQRYASVEHAYQAAKTDDPEQRKPFQHIPSTEGLRPGQAKTRGQRLKLRHGWHQMKVNVMEGLLRQKFAPGTELAVKLLATGDARIVEGNTWGDKFWGECDGQGENWLGRLLTIIRTELQLQACREQLGRGAACATEAVAK